MFPKMRDNPRPLNKEVRAAMVLGILIGLALWAIIILIGILLFNVL